MSESNKNLRDDNLGRNPFVTGYEVDVIADSDGKIRIATDQPTRGIVVLESPFPVNVTVAYNRNGYALLRVTRTWEVLDYVAIKTPTTAFTFDAALADEDSEIRIDGYWKQSASDTDLFLEINGANSTALSNCHSAFINTQTAGVATATGFVIAASGGAAAAEHVIEAYAVIDSANHRLLRGRSDSTDGTGATDTQGFAITGKWEDSSTEITSIGVIGAAGHILADSYFTLYRRPQLNKTKLKLWVY